MSSLFQKTLAEIQRNKKLQEEGKDLAIPFGFNRFDVVFPGIMKACYYLISANQKVGKTQITNALFIINVINFLEKNPNTNLDAKIFSFNLEMSKEALMRQLMCYRLYIKHGIRISPRQLQSLLKSYVVNDHIIQKIEADEKWFNLLNSKVEFIDHIKNPTGIWKYMREFARQNGKFFWKGKEIDVPEDADWELMKWDHYEPNNPDLIVMPIIDNVNLFMEERGKTLWDTIGLYSHSYCVKMRNNFYFSPVNIQQQAAANESIDGKKVDMQEPSASNLADNKTTAKDCDVFITIHSPFKNKKSTYNDYNIEKLRDYYRRFSIEVDRGGYSCETNLYFDGAVNLFKELPTAKDPKNPNQENPDMLKVYNLIKNQ